MTGLSRRALFPVAVGGALAAPQVAKGATQSMGEQAQASRYGFADTPLEDPNWRPRKRASLLEQKRQLERWARGEFLDDELDQNEPNPHYRRFATTEQEISGLRSVSASHKVRMAENVARRRYAAYRKKSAADYLSKIIQELAEL